MAIATAACNNLLPTARSRTLGIATGHAFVAHISPGSRVTVPFRRRANRTWRPVYWRVGRNSLCFLPRRHRLRDMSMMSHRLVRRALDALAPTRQSIAEQLGVDPSLLRYYRLGRRRPTADVLHRLSRLLRAQAKRLTALARQLERAARKGDA